MIAGLDRLVAATVAMLLASVAGAQTIGVAVRTPRAGIAFGEAFEIEVRRAWRAASHAEAFDERSLAPLSVELLASAPWTGAAPDGEPYDAGERRRYRARCFATGDVTIGPLEMRVREGDRVGMVRGGGVTIHVRSSLPEPAGGFEWPGDVRDLPGAPRWPWLVGAVALLAACVWWWRRPRALGEPAFAVVQPAMPTALRELRALVVPGDGADVATVVAFHQDVKRLVRQHCRERFAVAADVQTSEELLRAVGSNERAVSCLLACDLVLFAAVVPAAAERERALAAAIAFAEAAQ